MADDVHSTARGAVNPDMKRLCDSFPDPELDGFGSLSDEGREAIVRAVLMVLREPSREMQEAADKTGEYGENGWIRECWEWEHQSVLDYILDTKARRAAALQELADLDRDLL